MKKILPLFFFAFLFSCKPQNDVAPVKADLKEKNSKIKTFAGGDGAWDRLGYGIDATRELWAYGTISDAPILNVAKFAADYPGKTDINTTTQGTEELTSGASVIDYMHDYSYKASFDIGFSTPNIEGAKKNSTDYFSESVSQNNSDQNRTSYSNTHSFATYNSLLKIKRLRFTSEVTAEMLKPYLTADFVSNVSRMTPEAIVAKYGTHVLLDINLGGVIKFDYNGALLSETDYTKKTQQIKVGLGFGLLKVIGININSDRSSEEVTQITKSTSNRHYAMTFWGGTNSGSSINIDKDGNTSQSINIASWQQSINVNNAALIRAGKAIFLYNFISDPVKQAAVKAIIEQHIADSQIKTINTTPFYRLYNSKTARHFYTSNNSEVQTLIGLGFKVETTLGGLMTSQQPGSVPLYRWFRKSGGLDDHFYSTSNNISGYTSEGMVGYVYADPTETHLAIPVHQYFYPNFEHFFATSMELGTSAYGYYYDGIAFYLL